MSDYLNKFNEVRNKAASLLVNLDKTMENSEPEEAKAGCKDFSKRLTAMKRDFVLLSPPPLYQRIHRRFGKLLKRYKAVDKHIRKFLKTGEAEHFFLITGELPGIEAAVNGFYEEIQRYNAAVNEFYEEIQHNKENVRWPE